MLISRDRSRIFSYRRSRPRNANETVFVGMSLLLSLRFSVCERKAVALSPRVDPNFPPIEPQPTEPLPRFANITDDRVNIQLCWKPARVQT